MEESAKQATENNESTENQFDASLPPELRKLMEQTKQREEAAAAAEAAANKEHTLGDRSNTQTTAEDALRARELTQASLKEKKNSKDDQASSGTTCRRRRKVHTSPFDF